jgi:hypothetical protein
MKMSSTTKSTLARPSVAPDATQLQFVEHLEPDQLVAETFRPVPRARIGWRARVALWALRGFVLVVGVMVIYTFAVRL